MILEDVTRIRTTPGQVFGFFEEIERLYRAWHPDHVLFRWEEGRGVRMGVVFYFEEYIAGKLLKKRVRFTRIVPGRHMEFAPTWWLMRLFLPRISFHVEPDGAGCVVTQRIHVRTGPIGARLNRREFDAVRQHMRLEGENMRRILEGQQAIS